MFESEQFGTTALPSSSIHLGSGGDAGVEVTLDLWSAESGTSDVAQQPQSQELAAFEASRNDDCINGSLVDVNQHFVVYVVKNGLIRVLHRHSTMRTLLRGHQGQVVTDISFFLDGDVLATVGHSKDSGVSNLIVWRVFEQAPEIRSEKLLQVQSESAQMSRLLWHPFNSNQLWVIHSIGLPANQGQKVATLVETTRIQTTPHPQENHPVCYSYSSSVVADVEGAVQLSMEGGILTDLAWSGKNTRHVLTVHSNGCIVLWDLKETHDTTDPRTGSTIAAPKKLAVIDDTPANPQSRCLFLPHENALKHHTQTDILTTCFVTASHQNSVITIWSSFTTNPAVMPTKLQVLKLANPSPSYVLDVCFGPAPQEASPPSCFLLWADRHKGQLHAVHVSSQWNSEHTKALCVGADYVVPFLVMHPIYSWCVVCAPTQDIPEEDVPQHPPGLIFDMKLFSYQSRAVQCLTLTSYMCLPPKNSFQTIRNSTSVVSAKVLEEFKSSNGAIEATAGMDNGDGDSAGEPEYDEEYEIDGDDDYGLEDDDAEEETGAPSSTSNGSTSATNNPFENWLGAIASVATSAATTSVPLPPIPLPPVPPASDALPMPPPPPPPGLLQNANGAVDAVMKQAVKQTTAAPAPATTKGGSKGREATPNKQQKNKNKKNRSSSPKGGGKNKIASSFPDGAKISILKRDDRAPAAPAAPVPPPAIPPPPTNPAFVSQTPMNPLLADPAIVSMVPPPRAPPASTDPNMEEVIRRVVSEELAKQPGIVEAVEQAVKSQLVPSINKEFQESFASFGRPLQSSIDRLGQQGMRINPNDFQESLDLETPIRAAFADMIRGVYIPAMESLTAQILQQATPLPPPPPPPVPAPDTETKQTLIALTQQMIAMNSKIEILLHELKELKSRGVGATQATRAMPGAQPQSAESKLIEARKDITALLQDKQYERAFTMAASNPDFELVVFACCNADVNNVLGGDKPSLSQPVLLSILAHLGSAVAVTNQPATLAIEMEWLQEVALALNPADPSIQRNVPGVLQNVMQYINQKVAQGNPQFRRPLHMLQKIIRGMQDW